MKRVTAMVIFAVIASLLSAEDIQDEILGRWSAEPFIIEQTDGLLVDSDADYSLPYLGITGIDFIDANFVVFSFMDEEYRAFYEVESLDFDNYGINCVFKNGEEFLFKLVRIPGGSWKYLYRISEESVFSRVEPEDEEETQMPPEQDAGADSEMVESEVVYSIYTGIMKRK